MKSLVLIAATIGLSSMVLAQESTVNIGQDGESNDALYYAVAWKQTSAEYRALYHQGYNLARLHLEKAIAERREGDKPLAIISDLDDTILLPLTYWGYLINQNKDFFDDNIWDKWVPSNDFILAPGSKDFLEYAKENGVEIFYITSRDQGERTFDYALGNLKAFNLPFADEQHLTVLTDTSNKENRQNELKEKFNIVVMLGDNLNDFRRRFYLKGDVDRRIALVEEDKSLFGTEYILFPNPTDGHWLAAIFGESEPPASDTNRAILKDAATTNAWSPKAP